MGDSRGHWEGDTLVVETTNFTDRTGVGLQRRRRAAQRRAQDHRALHAHRRPTRIEYKITIDDPQTWTAPWTMRCRSSATTNYGMYEYACHEGNYALHNILSGARADERAAAAAAAPPVPTKK